MRFTNIFPYTTLNNINLDWIIKRVKELGETVRSYAQDIANAVALAEAAQDAADNAATAAQTAQDAADSATTAAQTAQDTADSAATAADIANKSVATRARSNLLINWYFAGGGSQLGFGTFPINQRGQTSYPNDGMCIDRWHTQGGASLTSSGINTSGNVLYQEVLQEDAKNLLGKTVTASALLSDGTLITGTATLPAAISETAVFEYSGTSGKLLYAVVTTGRIQILRFNIPASLDIVAAKVELGDTQTLAHEVNGAWILNELPDYARELEICRSFYLPNVGTGLAGYLLASGVGIANLTTAIPLHPLRAIEVVDLNNIVTASGGVSPISAVTGSIVTEGIRFRFTTNRTGAYEPFATANTVMNIICE